MSSTSQNKNTSIFFGIFLSKIVIVPNFPLFFFFIYAWFFFPF
jgi:hypothetical protein